MAQIKPALTITGTATDLGAALSLSASTTLTIDEPFIGVSRITATTTGANSVIAPSVNVPRYIYIKHTGLNDAGSSSGADKVFVELADSGDRDQIMELKSGEFAFFPYYQGEAGILQLEASANTVRVEYAYFTRG